MKPIRFFATAILPLLFTYIGLAQQLKLGKNPYMVEKSAILELQSDNQGLLLTRIADTTSINFMSPPDGMMIYFTPAKRVLIRANGYWQSLPTTIDTSGIANFYLKIRSLFSGTAPITYNNGTGQIGITQSGAAANGYLSSADWNTFNNKAGAFTKGNLAETGSGILTITGGSNAVIGSGTTIQVKQANTSQSGFLSSADWNTFNSKLSTIDTGNISNFYLKVRGLHTAGTGIGYNNGTGVISNTGVLSLNGNTGALTIDTGYINNFYIKSRSLFSGTAPITYNNGTGQIGIIQASTSTNGYLSSADWNTFNNKAASFTTGNLTETGSGILTITGGTGAVAGSGTAIQVKQANTSQNGFLSSTDWNTFNNKLSTIDTSNISNFYLKVRKNLSAGTGIGYNLTSGVIANTGVLSLNGNTGALTLDTGYINNFYIKSRSLFSGTAPITYNNGTGQIGITQASTSTNGYLSSADWNTFNNKAASFTTGNLTETGSGILTITGGTGAVAGSGTAIQVKQANTSQNGFLSSTDWNTFNNKLSTIDTSNISNFYLKVRGLHTAGAGIGYNNGTGVISNTGVLSLNGNTGALTMDTGYISNFYVKSRSLFSAGPGITYNAATGLISSSTSTANLWAFGGNTAGAIKTIGTIDNYDFPFITNNTERMRLSNTGNLGIGATSFDGTYPEKLLVNAGTTTSVNAIAGKGSINNYLQLNIQNQSNGTSASSDVVATADNGSETNNYIDMGINSSTNSSGSMGGANDAYLYNIGQNLLVGTGSASKSLVFMTGGTAQAINERMRIDGFGRVGIGVTNPTNPLVVKDTLEIRRTGTMSSLLFSNTAGSGDFRIGGDGGDLFWQGGGGRNLQMGAYWGILLAGDRQNAGYPAFSAGTANTNVLIQAQRDASVPLGIQGNSATQTANLTEWRSFSGTVLNAVDESGNVGIGTSNPTAKLHVEGTNPLSLFGVQTGTNTSTDSILTISSGIVKKLPASTFGAASSSWLLNGNAVSTMKNFGTTDNNHLPFITNNTERMRLSNTGNLGIGATTFDATYPERLLVNAGTTTSVNAIAGKGSINSYLQLNIQNQSAGTSASSDVVATANNGDETTNYVDMGINGSNYNGGVMGASNDSYLYNVGQNFLIGTGTAAKSLVLMTGGTSQASNERMRIDGTGNVGIGVTAPAQKLDVTGNFKLTGAFMPAGSAGNSGEFLTSNGAGTSPSWTSANSYLNSVAWLQAGNSGTTSTTDFIGTTDYKSFKIKTNNTQGFILDSLGSVGIGDAPAFTSGANREQLLVDAGPTSSVNSIVGRGSINSYLQLNIQNQSNGTGASSDVVATADNGSETTNYIDMGINSSTNTSGAMGGFNDSYLYNIGQNLLIGTGTAAKSLVFMTGGTSQSANERMRIDGTGKVGIGTNAPASDLTLFQANGGANPARGFRFTGNSISGNNSGSGFSLALGYNIANNKQLWLGDADYLGSSGGTFLRYSITNGFPTFDAVAGDGLSRRSIALGVGGDANSAIVLGGDFNATAPSSYIWGNGNMAIGASYRANAAPANGLIVQGNTGIGLTAPTAALHLRAGTATASTGAPLKFTSGTTLTTAEDGAVEYDGTNYYATSGTTRYTLAKTLTATASLDFPSIMGVNSTTLTIAVPGAADGDVVSLGVPNTLASVSGVVYSGYVSSANVVTVRYTNNNSLTAINPAAATFRVTIIKY